MPRCRPSSPDGSARYASSCCPRRGRLQNTLRVHIFLDMGLKGNVFFRVSVLLRLLVIKYASAGSTRIPSCRRGLPLGARIVWNFGVQWRMLFQHGLVAFVMFLKMALIHNTLNALGVGIGVLP